MYVKELGSIVCYPEVYSELNETFKMEIFLRKYFATFISL